MEKKRRKPKKRESYIKNDEVEALKLSTKTQKKSTKKVMAAKNAKLAKWGQDYY